MARKKIVQKELDKHEWFLVDVRDKVLGRAATRIATLLSGKYRTDFTPHLDLGGGVVVLNCDKVLVTGDKARQKVYKRYSGYPKGLRETVYNDMFKKDPKYIIRHAVKGMLPKNKLGERMIGRLKVYVGEEHPHIAQKPTAITI